MSRGRTPGDRLSRVIAEIRATEGPAPRLHGLEERLTREFRRAAAAGELRSASPGRGTRAAFWVAAAAAAVLGVGVVHELVTTGSEERVAVSSGVRSSVIDGFLLERGAALEAGAEQGLRVEHAGHVTWELARGSRARMLDVRPGALQVELEHGSLSASVVPGQAESFVVHASGTEVAVHGTRFDVALEERRVFVAVTEGEVEVRPSSRSVRTLLSAGMSGRFIAGVPQPDREATLAATEPPVAEPAASEAQPSAAAPSPATEPSSATAARPPRSGVPRPRRAVSPAAGNASRGVSPGSPASPEAPPAPPAHVVDAAVTRVTEHIESCFRRHTQGQGAVSIQAASRLGLEVQPNGLILEVHLEPPLAPQVEHCVASELASVNLGASEGGFRVQREIRVSR